MALYYSNINQSGIVKTTNPGLEYLEYWNTEQGEEKCKWNADESNYLRVFWTELF